jgi:hypothetical protein
VVTVIVGVVGKTSGPTDNAVLVPICLKEVHVYCVLLAVHFSVLLSVIEHDSVGCVEGDEAIVAAEKGRITWVSLVAAWSATMRPEVVTSWPDGSRLKSMTARLEVPVAWMTKFALAPMPVMI